MRDIGRKTSAGDEKLERLPALAGRIHTQQRHHKKKVYRVHAPLGDTGAHLVGRRKKKPSRTLRKWLKRRAALEPIIGHLNSGHRMHRNPYQGQTGDAINALPGAAGFAQLAGGANPRGISPGHGWPMGGREA